ncbi:MAG: lipoate--protein ligase, partial [Clostridia bacterium]|nr:lipoate--protein ligase [Clostridia bacterium]
LALEEALLTRHEGGVCLYLWQNRSTVVIGRNQNAWRECRVDLLESEGGVLSRRSTGGGAVYHDLGNLNFSFIADKARYDVPRQLSVLAEAVSDFGLRAEVSGRNDLLLGAGGEKFSGNAFRVGENACLHHGTILIGVDMERLSRYLAPSPEKLRAKGVSSVRARVTNLCAHCPAVTAESMKAAMLAAFRRVYGPAERLEADAFAGPALDALEARYASWAWRFGRTPPFDLSLTARFDWGGVELLLRFERGLASGVRLYTDSLDERLPETVESALRGAACAGPAMRERLAQSGSPEARDIGSWLGGLRF